MIEFFQVLLFIRCHYTEIKINFGTQLVKDVT